MHEYAKLGRRKVPKASPKRVGNATQTRRDIHVVVNRLHRRLHCFHEHGSKKEFLERVLGNAEVNVVHPI